MDAIILAGGKGTRLAPLTNFLPKALVLVGGKAIIEHTLESLPDAITRVCIVIGEHGEQIIQHLEQRYHTLPVTYVRQNEPKGTGHAFLLTGSHIRSDRFLVLNGDDLYDKAELTAMLQHPRAMAVHPSLPKSERYLAIMTNDDQTIAGHRYPEHLGEPILVGTGAYLLDRTIFLIQPVAINGTKEYGLPHAVLQLAQSHPITAHHMHRWFQINDHADLARAEQRFSHDY